MNPGNSFVQEMRALIKNTTSDTTVNWLSTLIYVSVNVFVF